MPVNSSIFNLLLLFLAVGIAFGDEDKSTALPWDFPKNLTSASRLSLESKSVRASAKENDVINELKIILAGGTIKYSNPYGNSPRFLDNKAMGVEAMITERMIDEAQRRELGSGAYKSPEKPPGFDDIANQGGIPNRGHLLGRQLGGSGEAYLNIVALHRNPNAPVMSHWEDRVAKVYSSGRISSSCKVWYTAKPSYQNGGNGPRHHPTTMRLSTSIYNPNSRQLTKWFEVLIDNEAWATVQNAQVHIDAEAAGGLFPMNC